MNYENLEVLDYRPVLQKPGGGEGAQPVWVTQDLKTGEIDDAGPLTYIQATTVARVCVRLRDWN